MLFPRPRQPNGATPAASHQRRRRNRSRFNRFLSLWRVIFLRRFLTTELTRSFPSPRTPQAMRLPAGRAEPTRPFQRAIVGTGRDYTAPRRLLQACSSAAVLVLSWYGVVSRPSGCAVCWRERRHTCSNESRMMLVRSMCSLVRRSYHRHVSITSPWYVLEMTISTRATDLPHPEQSISHRLCRI